MKTVTAPSFCTSATVRLSVSDLRSFSQSWLMDCEARRHSHRTVEARRQLLDKLLWYLQQEEMTHCGRDEIRRFLRYVSHGHKNAGGRWGGADREDESQKTRAMKPVTERTVHTYHGHLRTFFRWIVADGYLDASPMDGIAAPI